MEDKNTTEKRKKVHSGHKGQWGRISKEEKDLISPENKTIIDDALLLLAKNEDLKEISLPSHLSNTERKYVHTKAREYGFKTKSKGVEPNRFVSVFKSAVPINVLTLTTTSFKMIKDLIKSNPVPGSISNEPGQLKTTAQRKGDEENLNQWRRAKLIIPHTNMKRTKQFRDSLPIAAQNEEIVSAIENERIVIIVGETGSGKTTQVPQMILEHSELQNKGCQIICSMPRRVAAVMTSERVAHERGEPLGRTVGYQIRLDSKVSSKTCLTYCTNGVLLRFLLTGDNWLQNVSHIIIDEVHERDKITDFTMIVLKDALAKYKHLKLILMSATIDSDRFKKYFENCPETGNECQIVEVPGRMYEVKDIYLEDILEVTDYMTQEMYKEKEERDLLKPFGQDENESMNSKVQVYSLAEKLAMLHPRLMDEMEYLLGEALTKGDSETLKSLVKFMVENNIPVDYPHPECGRTALMAAAIFSDVDAVEELIEMDPDLSVESREGKTALMYAEAAGDPDVLGFFDNYLFYCDQVKSRMGDFEVSPKVQEMIEIYEKCHLTKDIDENLIVQVLKTIHDDGREGAVLIFLPGYEHIVCVKEKILENQRVFESKPLDIYILHSKMKSVDQKKAFDPAPRGHRKVILSTNIAETSVTINDVVFVIDCGKVKEFCFNSITGAYSLDCDWISRACAEQRRGRAGRTKEGVCFHLYSRKRFNSFRPFKIPDLLREPIAEICLQTKRLAPKGTSIVEFLERAIDPPQLGNVRSTINLLKKMEALTENEELTDLGLLLLKIPMEPHFGKMIVYGAILRCLDPVLTIVCCLSSGEVFKLPVDRKTREVVTKMRQDMAKGTHSDHMIFIQSYQEWERALKSNCERKWCLEHFVNPSAMEMIQATKKQILEKLNVNWSFVNENSGNWVAIKAALTAGSYPKLAKFNQNKKSLQTPSGMRVMIHQSSVLKREEWGAAEQPPSEWLLFEESMQIREFSKIRTCTVISPITICIFAGPSNIPSYKPLKGDEDNTESEIFTLNIDPDISFNTDSFTTQCLIYVREMCNIFIKEQIKTFGSPPSQDDEKTLKTILHVLENEETSVSDIKEANICLRVPKADEFLSRRPKQYQNNGKRSHQGFARGGRGSYGGDGDCSRGGKGSTQNRKGTSGGDWGSTGGGRGSAQSGRGSAQSGRGSSEYNGGSARSRRGSSGGVWSSARGGRGSSEYNGGSARSRRGSSGGDWGSARGGRGSSENNGGSARSRRGSSGGVWRSAQGGRGYSEYDWGSVRDDWGSARSTRGSTGGDWSTEDWKRLLLLK